MKTALVIGGTGMVGKQLVQLLFTKEDVAKVVLLGRRPSGFSHPKLEEHVVDFKTLSTWGHLLQGDVLFSSLGTTLKQAGGKKQQYEVDFTFQLHVATAAARNRVPVFVLVSSAGANPKSPVFYSRMKGELEQHIQSLAFKSTNIIRPGLLTGERETGRTGERIGFHMLTFLNKVGLFRRYRPVKAVTVAQAMYNAFDKAIAGVQVYELEELFTLAER